MYNTLVVSIGYHFSFEARSQCHHPLPAWFAEARPCHYDCQSTARRRRGPPPAPTGPHPQLRGPRPAARVRKCLFPGPRLAASRPPATPPATPPALTPCREANPGQPWASPPAMRRSTKGRAGRKAGRPTLRLPLHQFHTPPREEGARPSLCVSAWRRSHHPSQRPAQNTPSPPRPARRANTWPRRGKHSTMNLNESSFRGVVVPRGGGGGLVTRSPSFPHPSLLSHLKYLHFLSLFSAATASSTSRRSRVFVAASLASRTPRTRRR